MIITIITIITIINDNHINDTINDKHHHHINTNDNDDANDNSNTINNNGRSINRNINTTHSYYKLAADVAALALVLDSLRVANMA